MPDASHPAAEEQSWRHRRRIREAARLHRRYCTKPSLGLRRVAASSLCAMATDWRSNHGAQRQRDGTPEAWPDELHQTGQGEGSGAGGHV